MPRPLPAGRTRDALEDARTVPAPAPSSRPGTRGRSRQTPRTSGGASRATPASFDEVQRALQEHPENVSLNSTPVAGAPVNATHQQRWELFGGEGPAPPYFRAGDRYHVDRVFAEQAGDVEAALYQRLADGWRRMGAAAGSSSAPDGGELAGGPGSPGHEAPCRRHVRISGVPPDDVGGCSRHGAGALDLQVRRGSPARERRQSQ